MMMFSTTLEMVMKNTFNPILTQVLADSIQIRKQNKTEILDSENFPPPIKEVIRDMRGYLLHLFERRVQSLNGELTVEEVQHVLEHAIPDVVELLEKMAKVIYVMERAPSYNYHLNWFDVRDRFPEPNEDVFYFFEVTGTSLGKYRGNGQSNEFGGPNGFLGDDVTHWAYPPSIDF